MSSIVNVQQPLPLLVSSGTLAAGATLQVNQANVLGYSRIVGNVFSSVAPAAGWPLITQGADGLTADLNYVISQDTTQSTSFNYPIDIPIYGPYVSVQVKDAGAGSTVRVAVYAIPFASPSSIQTNTTANPTYSTIRSYTACFNGLVAPGGQFFELAGAVGVVGRIREIYVFKPSVSVELKALLQSIASTGGTSTTSATKHDQNNVANSLTAKQYTVAPTPGTSVGNVLDIKSLTAGDSAGFSFGDVWDQPIVVRSGQSFALSTDVAATIYGYVRWTEATS